jgi:hypothetical protein
MPGVGDVGRGAGGAAKKVEQCASTWPSRIIRSVCQYVSADDGTASPHTEIDNVPRIIPTSGAVVHTGTAPDIAGKGLANPTTLILSGALLLRHVGGSGRRTPPTRQSLISNWISRTCSRGGGSVPHAPLGTKPLRT